MLTKDEEKQLAEIIQDENSTDEEKHRAHDQLFSENMNLAYKIAWQIKNKAGDIGFLDIEDLTQEALFALSNCIWEFDPEKDCKLSTFAYYKIFEAVKTAINNSHTVKIPYYLLKEYSKLKRLEDEYQQEHEEKPSLAWLSEKSGLSEEKIQELDNLLSPSFSLENEMAGGNEYIDFVKDPEQEQDRLENSPLYKIVTNLPPVAREIILAEAGISGKSKKEIKAQYKISTQKYNKIHGQVTTVLRREVYSE